MKESITIESGSKRTVLTKEDVRKMVVPKGNSFDLEKFVTSLTEHTKKNKRD